ncbi:MAG: hypothetical protein R2705_04845 [Ilumatobacteraceae bacterium]
MSLGAVIPMWGSIPDALAAHDQRRRAVEVGDGRVLDRGEVAAGAVEADRAGRDDQVAHRELGLDRSGGPDEGTCESS